MSPRYLLCALALCSFGCTAQVDPDPSSSPPAQTPAPENASDHNASAHNASAQPDNARPGDNAQPPTDPSAPNNPSDPEEPVDPIEPEEPTDPLTPNDPDVEGVGEDCKVDQDEGICLETSDCASPGVATPGHCPGPAQVQCCTVPEPDEPTDPMDPEDPKDPIEPPPAGQGCASVTAPSSGSWSVEHDGRTRQFEVHIPAGYSPGTPAPVVLDFHGRNSSASQQILISGMQSLADDKGFIAVHPSGYLNTWNAGLCCGSAQAAGIDDVGFVNALLDKLEQDACVDTKRVFATGLSNGGFISHRLGCELSDRIAAIAPVAGTLLSSSCNPTRGVSVMHIHGTADAIVPYGGFVGFVSVEDSIDAWRAANACTTGPTQVYQNGDVRCEQWSGCRDGAAVQLCTVDGGGHQWPGGFGIPGLGHKSDDIDASAAMWDFFTAHPMP